jgi:hypothetical protein
MFEFGNGLLRVAAVAFGIALLGIVTVHLITPRGSRARAWLTTSPARTSWVGVGMLLLIWIAVAVVNRLSEA